MVSGSGAAWIFEDLELEEKTPLRARLAATLSHAPPLTPCVTAFSTADAVCVMAFVAT